MSNLPPNPYNNVQRGPQMNASQAPPAFNHSQQIGQVPLSQLPPGYAGTKQDAHSNSPLHAPTSAPQNHALQNVNNYSQSGSSSPAFNQPGGLPPSYTGVQASIKPPVSIGPPKSSTQSNVSSTSGSPSPFNANPSPIPHSQNIQPLQNQINNIAPPLVPSSQFNQPLINGPPNPPMSMYPGAMTSNLFPASSNTFSSLPVNKPLTGGSNLPLNQAFGPPVSKPTGPMTSQQSTPFPAPLGSAPRNSPLMQGPPISGPPLNAPPGPAGPVLGPPGPISVNGPSLPPVSGLLGSTKPLASGLPPASNPGPYMNGPTMSGPTMSRLPINPPMTRPMGGQPMSGPPMTPPSGPQSLPAQFSSGPQSLPAQFSPGPQQPPMGHQMAQPGSSQPPTGPPKTNMQSRYPQMQPGGYNQPQMPPQPMGQYPQQYNTQNMTQQMGNLSVTKQGFDQLWGHQAVDLMQCKHILPEYPEDIFRCTVNRIPETNNVFLPSPESLLVNLGERKELIKELLTVLPQRYSTPGVPTSALGAALQAAYKLMTCLPNVGPGALQSREDPNARSSKDVAHLNPATDFYKRLALDCSGAQVAVDLFLLNSQYSDLATLTIWPRSVSTSTSTSDWRSTAAALRSPSTCSCSTHSTAIWPRSSARAWQAEQLNRMFSRYLTRKIGFEAVMRVRATRGVAIHTFHGNFFVRSTDLLSLPNVSPDAGFGMQLSIEESLHDLQHVCFQAALLYTSSKGTECDRDSAVTSHAGMQLSIEESLLDLQHVCFQAALLYTSSKGTECDRETVQ
ncbi:Protein transport protein Sec24B [Operophtera brumata]|uniref:Protein transport protein Sec24B n=1 Tax=Operophtera brumata TaxID=104452 RepID=A0A0L7LHJ6_OPEBR|nr:Protein transport protein Sec24B [Operophtera brumata]